VMDKDTTDRNISVEELEEGSGLYLDFDRISKVAARVSGIMPVVVQNVDTKEVILLAYTDNTAFRKSLETGIATFWSTSRNELWVKGATSGNTFALIEVRVNDEQNALVYLVRPDGGGICHTRNSKGQNRNCFYRQLNRDTGKLINLDP
jgi:phosphoribosyl-AMP cyclohydrolase